MAHSSFFLQPSDQVISKTKSPPVESSVSTPLTDTQKSFSKAQPSAGAGAAAHTDSEMTKGQFLGREHMSFGKREDSE